MTSLAANSSQSTPRSRRAAANQRPAGQHQGYKRRAPFQNRHSMRRGCICRMMMMMMTMMDKLTLTWHIVLRLQGHVTVKKESRIVNALVDCTSRDSCMSKRKARSSVYHEKLDLSYRSKSIRVITPKRALASGKYRPELASL